MSKKLLELEMDGWYPRLNPSCTHIVCGSATITCFSINGTVLARYIGRCAGWFSDHEFYFVEDQGENSIIWRYDINTRLRNKIGTFEGGNIFICTIGNWASWREENRRILFNGLPLGIGGYYGLSLRGKNLVTTSNDRFAWFENGELVRDLPLPSNANLFNVGDKTIYYGYFGPTFRADWNATTEDISITPWKKESVVKDWNAWYWSATETPLGEFWMLGRPKSSTKAIIIKDFPCVDFDVQSTEVDFYVVGNDEDGTLRLFSANKNEELQEVKEGSLNPPRVTIDPAYSKILTSTNHWTLDWHDRNNEGFSGKVEFINGSVHISFTNPEGNDRSASERKVAIHD